MTEAQNHAHTDASHTEKKTGSPPHENHHSAPDPMEHAEKIAAPHAHPRQPDNEHRAHQSRDYHKSRANAHDYREKKASYVQKLHTRHFNTRIWKPFDRMERWKKIATGITVATGIIGIWWGVWSLLDNYLIPEQKPLNYILGIGAGLLVILATGEIIEGGGR